MATTFCSKCGTPNTDDSRFCSKCGAPLASSPKPARPPNKPSAPQDYSDHPQAGRQQPFYGAPPKRKKTGLKITLIVVAALAVAAGIFFGVRALSGGGEDEGYYEIGGERIPSVSYALGEARKLQSMKDTNNNGVETLSFIYDVSSGQGDMRAYAGYLQSKDGFSLRTAGASFDQKTGSGIQLWRNAEAAGFMVIVQLDYDEKGYTVTVMRGAGQASGAPTISDPPATTPPPATDPSEGVPVTNAPAPTGETYVNTTVGFSITPRDGWYAEETTSNGTPIVRVTTPKNNRIVIMSMSGYTTADFAAEEEDFCLATAQSMGYDGYKIDRSETIKFAGYDCHLTGFTVTAQNTLKNYIYNYAFDGGSGKLYIISYLLPTTATDADHQEILDVFSTFKIQ